MRTVIDVCGTHRRCPKHFASVIPLILTKAQEIPTHDSILYLRKPRLKEVELLAQGHTAGEIKTGLDAQLVDTGSPRSAPSYRGTRTGRGEWGAPGCQSCMLSPKRVVLCALNNC